MKVIIREVKKIDDDTLGRFERLTKYTSRITIGMDGNRTLAQYGETVLHELLHLWIAILEAKGFKISEKREHKFIESVERMVTRAALLHMRRKKHANRRKHKTARRD